MPSSASPTTCMFGSSSINLLSPSRKMRWSSASRIFSFSMLATCRSNSGERNGDNYRSACARIDLELTSDQLHSLLHAHQSQPAVLNWTTHELFRVEANAIVLDNYSHSTIVSLQNNAHNLRV